MATMIDELLDDGSGMIMKRFQGRQNWWVVIVYKWIATGGVQKLKHG